jgi:histidine kinase family protein
MFRIIKQVLSLIHPGEIDSQADQDVVKTTGSIKWRLMLPISSIFLVLIISSISAIYAIYDNDMKTMFAHSIEEISKDMDLMLDEQADGLASCLKVIASDDCLPDILKDRDKEALLQNWQPVFNKLNESNQITHFYFQGPDRINILRVHKPKKNGDLINRHTTLEAERTGSVASGIELGPLGTFTLRVVIPVFSEGILIGYIELGKEIEDILSVLHGSPDVELSVNIKKEFLDRGKWESGMTMLKRNSDWERCPDNVEIYRSPGWKGSGCNSKVGIDNDMGVFSIPLKDVKGTYVGDIVGEHNVSSENNRIKHKIILFSGIAGLGLIFLLFFIYVLVSRTDESIRQHNANIKKTSKKLLGANKQLMEKEEKLSWANQLLKSREDELRASEQELQERMGEMEKINSIMMGREFRVIEIKKEVNKLCRDLGQPERYKEGLE